MSKHLRNDLTKLEKRLLRLGNRVEAAVRDAIGAVVDRNVEQAEGVIEGDNTIDDEEVQIEEDCLKILALHQPVATDLRFVTACLKINSDLERIGDLAVNIAKRACSLGKNPQEFDMPESLKPMLEEALTMVRESLDAFVRGDAELAIQVLGEDAHVDELNRETIHSMVERMRAGGDAVDPALRVLSISKHLERIADHATNIAEDVIYFVTGDIIRHHPEYAGELD